MKQTNTTVLNLGVEGGATKSTAVLVNEKGETILAKKGSAINYRAMGIIAAKKNLKELMGPFLKHNKANKINAVFGLAGLNTTEDEKTYKKIISSILPKNIRYEVYNDAKIALETKCPNTSNRILAISGTGANVYGEANKKTARSIGWDFILGDEGGSYYVGLHAMRAAVQSWDGRIKKTLLEKTVLRKAETKTMQDFLSKIYKINEKRPEELKRYIASFSILVDQAILKNDWTAKEIREDVFANLLSGITAIATRLNFKNKSFCLGFVGSGWNMPQLQTRIKNSVKKHFPKVIFSKNKDNSGVWGAVLLAQKMK